MEKLNISSEEPRDRLSELPDSILFEIFWLFRMDDVVQTTFLSKRWNNLWTTTPYLNFDYHAPGFVNRALILWRGLKILKFKFAFHGSLYINKSLVSDMDSWVRLAKDYGVEELYFNFSYSLFQDDGIGYDDDSHDEALPELYYVPDILYSCSLLKVLSLKGCKLQIDGNVHWNRLRSLMTQDVFVDEHSINQIVSGSPHLEVFDLDLKDCGENLNIRSSSLKRLSIKRSIVYSSAAPELRIWSSNLETLDFSGIPYGKYSLMNVSSLTHLTLDFHCYDGINDLYGETLWQIFSTIPHVEELTLSGWCIKVLGAMEDKHLLPPLSNFKFLTIIKNGYVEYKQIVDILQVFRQLKRLVLDSTYVYWIPASHPDSFVHVERNLPESFLLQLRTVEISCYEGDSLMFPFIETLLKHAIKLQKMAIRVKKQMKSPLMPLFLETQQKVLRMPRCSPTAELIFAEF